MITAHDIVSGYTQPIYNWFIAHSREIVYIIIIIVCMRIMVKIGKSIKSGIYRKSDAGTTNTWFKWDEFEEWKSRNEDNGGEKK